MTPMWLLIHILAGWIVCAASMAAGHAAAQNGGYVGLTLRDSSDAEDGHFTVVSWIFPGPLGGNGLESDTHDLARPDLIVAVDGQAMNADGFAEYVTSKKPGETLEIDYRRSNARGGAIPSAINHEEEVRSITVTLESRDEWTGTMQRGRMIQGEVEFDSPAFLDPDNPANILGEAVQKFDLKNDLDRLRGVFRQWQERDDDAHSLAHTRAPFFEPFRMVELAGKLDLSVPREDVLYRNEIALQPNPIKFASNLLREMLHLQGIGGAIGIAGIGADIATTSAGKELALDLASAQTWHQFAFGTMNRKGAVFEDAVFPSRVLDFLRVPGRTFYISGPNSKDAISIIGASLDVNWDAFGNALLDYERDVEPIDVEDLRTRALVDAPPAAAGIVEGTIIEAIETDLGWIVIGGAGPNRYDMSKVIAVYDIGGDDSYYASDLCLGNRAIIDLAGNDRYTGTADQGPASALLGFSFVDDRAGDDRYEGELLSAGAACYGVSLLLDRGGNDTYIGREWSLGAGVYGAGMIFDLGGGCDTYLGEFLCQGVGGPRGFGCILDDGGDDLYRANGPKPSAYGTPAVYQSFSQGFGFGYRNYAAGGIGILSDLGGNDRYEAGEFAQGGAYYYALGLLHDTSGNDIYYGNRYGQGFGVHQAHGMLVDDAGDDTYYSMTAASQGAAWDIGVGMLLDRAGNDSYQCDGLGQGGAAQQGIAYLIDMDGVDRYIGRSSTQGESGGNDYHFAETGAYSFSLLLDLGGDEDFYSRGRRNNETTLNDTIDANSPANSSAHGVTIDR